MDQNPKDFETTGITLLPTGNKYARINTILEDVLLWAFERKHIPFNLLIISHEITDDFLYVKALMFWKDRTGNILLAQPENLAHDDLSNTLFGQVTAVWRWNSLSYGRNSIFIPGRKQVVSQLVSNKGKGTSLGKGKSIVQGESSIVKVKTTHYRNAVSETEGYTKNKTEGYTKNIKVSESSSTHRRRALTELPPVIVHNKFDVLAL